MFGREIEISILPYIAKYFPNKKISGSFSKLYSCSLHKDMYGEEVRF